MTPFLPGDLVVRQPFPRAPGDKTVEGWCYVIAETVQDRGVELVRVEGHSYGASDWHRAEAFAAYEPVDLLTEEILAMDGLELAKTIF